MKLTRRLALCAAVLAFASGGLAACTDPGPGPVDPGPVDPGPVDPGPGGPGQIGPAPTEAILTAARGPFPTTSRRVGRQSGFAGGTINYPTQSLGRLGAAVIVPGFMSGESSISWWGPRLASHGFVVMTIPTNTVGDFPPMRAQQQQAALRFLSTAASGVADRVDPNRLAAGGWSMGGGGSLQAAGQNANIKVVLPMAPWNPGSRYTYNKPTFIISCSSDAIAGNASNSNVFYGSLSGPKAQLTLSGSHFCPTTPNTNAARYAVAWFKRYLDGDTRYTSFVCRPTSNYRNANAC
jgi:hypothetical protein